MENSAIHISLKRNIKARFRQQEHDKNEMERKQYQINCGFTILRINIQIPSTLVYKILLK